MKFYQYMFYLLVAFNLIIHNVNTIDSFDRLTQIVLSLVSISLAIIVGIVAFNSPVERDDEVKREVKK